MAEIQQQNIIDQRETPHPLDSLKSFLKRFSLLLLAAANIAGCQHQSPEERCEQNATSITAMQLFNKDCDTPACEKAIKDLREDATKKCVEILNDW